MAPNIEFEEILIDGVREHPCLYNKKVDSYKDSKIKQNAWISIAATLHTTANECENKWASLRSQFLAHMKKLKNPTGCGNKRSRPSFRHERRIDFILENDTSAENSFSNIDDEKQHQAAELTPLGNNLYEIPSDFALPIPTDPLPGSSAAGGVSETRPRCHKKFTGKRQLVLDPVDEKIFQAMDQSQQDEFALFCKSMAFKLREICAMELLRIFNSRYTN